MRSPLLLVLCGFVGGYIFEQRILTRLRSISQRTGWQGYQIFIVSLRGMTLLWFAIAGIFVATLTIPLDDTMFFPTYSPQGDGNSGDKTKITKYLYN